MQKAKEGAEGGNILRTVASEHSVPEDVVVMAFLVLVLVATEELLEIICHPTLSQI